MHFAIANVDYFFMLAQFFSSDQPQSAPNPSVLHSYAYKKGAELHSWAPPSQIVMFFLMIIPSGGPSASSYAWK